MQPVTSFHQISKTTWRRCTSAIRRSIVSYSPTHTQTETILDYLTRHRDWSWHSFGTPADGRGPAGPHNHIAKELKEIEADPDDLEEWIDVIILSIDGCLRAGCTLRDVEVHVEGLLFGNTPIPRSCLSHVESQHAWVGSSIDDRKRWLHLVTFAIGAYMDTGGKVQSVLPKMFAKQAKNFARDWPDWRKFKPGQAIEHVRDESEQLRKMRELNPQFTGVCVGGPYAGRELSHVSRHYDVALPPPMPATVSYAPIDPMKVETSFAKARYIHVIGIQFGAHGVRKDFWMLDTEIKKAEDVGKLPAQHAFEMILEEYAYWQDMKNS